MTPPRQQAASVRRPCGRRRAKDPEQWVDLRQEDEWESEEEEDDDDVGYNPEAHQQLLAAGQGAGCAAATCRLPLLRAMDGLRAAALHCTAAVCEARSARPQAVPWTHGASRGPSRTLCSPPLLPCALPCTAACRQQREVMPDTLGWQLQSFQPLQAARSMFPAETEEGQAPGGGEPGAAPPATREQQQQRLQGVLGMSAQRRQYLQIEPDQQFIPPWHKMRYQMPEAAPQLSEWDLRAKMEKRRRQAVEDRGARAWPGLRGLRCTACTACPCCLGGTLAACGACSCLPSHRQAHRPPAPPPPAPPVSRVE